MNLEAAHDPGSRLSLGRPRGTIRQRIFRANLAMGIGFLLALVIALLQVNRLAAAITVVHAARSQAVAAYDVQRDSTALTGAIGRLLPIEDLTAFQSEVGPALEALQVSRANLAVVAAQTPQDAAALAALDRVGKRAGDVVGSADTMVHQASSNQWSNATLGVDALLLDQQKLTVETDRLVELAQETEQTAMSEVASARQAAVFFPVLVGGLAVVLGAVLTWRTANGVAAPVARLADGAVRLATGQGGEQVTVASNDELGQLAAALDQMADRFQTLDAELEERVADRTRDLERRAGELMTAANVGRAAVSILELDVLARQVVELVREGFGLYYVGLFLLDEPAKYAVLQAGTGEAGQVMQEAGHKLEVGGPSVVGAACAEREARIALDVGLDRVRFDNPLLPDTRSEMALPLIVGERALGCLDVQSVRPAAFAKDDIAMLQLVADQVAVAVDNALKFSKEAEVVEATNPFYRVSRRLAAAGTTEQIAQAIILSVAEADADGCIVGRLGTAPDGEVVTVTFLEVWNRRRKLQLATSVPFPAGTAPFPLQMISTAWTIEDISRYRQMAEGPRQFLTQLGGRAFLNMLLRAGPEEQTIGFLMVHRATPGPFSTLSLRLYETLADQAAVALERTRLLEESQRQAWREHTIREISDQVTSSFDVEVVLQATIEQLGRMMGAGGGYAELGWTEEVAAE
jgi:GAF domain-containing protein/HAMP domain-containing protein